MPALVGHFLFICNQPPPMTEEAKAERREAALKAAESRTKDWGKRLDKGRQASQTKTATTEVRVNENMTTDEWRRLYARRPVPG